MPQTTKSIESQLLGFEHNNGILTASTRSTTTFGDRLRERLEQDLRELAQLEEEQSKIKDNLNHCMFEGHLKLKDGLNKLKDKMIAFSE